METAYNQILELTSKLNGHQLEALTYHLTKEINKKFNPFANGKAEGFEVEIVAYDKEPEGFILTSYERLEPGNLYLICEYLYGQYSYSLVTVQSEEDATWEGVHELKDGGTDWLEQLTPIIQEFLNVPKK